MYRLCLLFATMTLLPMAPLAWAQAPDLSAAGNDIPAAFSPVTEEFNHKRLEAMIPMRDGVKLFTVILIPKTHGERAPIILTRTPYSAAKATSRFASPRIAMALSVAPPERAGRTRLIQA